MLDRDQILTTVQGEIVQSTGPLMLVVSGHIWADWGLEFYRLGPYLVTIDNDPDLPAEY